MRAATGADPFAAGRWLARPPLHRLWYCEGGDPYGRPVLVIHGGPGGRSRPESVAGFDGLPLRWIVTDQRGCGRSQPLGELRDNTLADLLADLEALRAHLGLDGWAIAAGSWGAFVALAYAATHPQRVQGLFLRSPFLGSAPELAHYGAAWVDWLGEDGQRWLDGPAPAGGSGDSVGLDLAAVYRPGAYDLSRVAPEGGAPRTAEDRLALAAQAYDDAQSAAGGVAATGARWSRAQMERAEAQSEAARAAWRVHAHYGQGTGQRTGKGTGQGAGQGAWTVGHDAWGWARQVLPDLAGRGRPLMLVHGEQDAVCPVATSEQLAALAGPAAELRRVPGGGHRMGAEPMATALRAAAARWGQRLVAAG